ncbi:MAG: ABC transporter substrate-binding protein [Candidatus Tectomicrobia bacterium RIFCSPLOWO2_12_FULL_69_37]|nr:MAG: ABC transporter substrate-binding protein [Candidatus Tectomicrobia bacterium RIFCSPLOWO2_02_FULL_70_19]OGL60953.1 MAG: ABC transporter substrate-binding protein [Candidatus Tectomicrobia bacterium RIFCSPLOWO2_12_FULL_69_37]
MTRRSFLKLGAGAAAGAGVLPFLRHLPAEAAVPKDTLVVLISDVPNSMDIHRPGTNRPGYQSAINFYDRLLTYGRKTLPDGSLSYDYRKVEPELAESWQAAPDGSSITFKLRKDAKFHDGSPVTAHDVKWSFDRAVSVGGFPTIQMKAGAMEKPAQFAAVDDHTFRVNVVRKSKLMLPDLAVPVAVVVNSKLAKKHATAKDPWALEYLHKNSAGGGPYKLERWDPGRQAVYARFDGWKSGPLPAIKRAIIREVPNEATRRALIVRGDADLSFDIAPKDAKELLADPKLKVVGTPIENCIHVLCLNLKFKPFDDVRVRQAVAYAVPYEQIFKVAAYERGVKLWGAKSADPKTIEWPQPFPYETDLDRAKALLKAAGLPNGFESTLSFNLGLAYWSEPAALLLQEGLGKVGIRLKIDKIPGANWRTKALIEKALPVHLENFGGWLNYPEYYYFWCYQSGRLFNSSSYNNPEVNRLVDETLDAEVGSPGYEEKIKKFLQIGMREVPRIPLYQPYLEVAMQKNVEGYEFWFHRQLVVKKLKKA